MKTNAQMYFTNFLYDLYEPKDVFVINSSIIKAYTSLCRNTEQFLTIFFGNDEFSTPQFPSQTLVSRHKNNYCRWIFALTHNLYILPLILSLTLFLTLSGRRGSSVGRARYSWWRGPGFDPRCGRPLPTGWVGASIMLLAETEVMVSPLCLVCGST